jgi:hypothetical protein
MAGRARSELSSTPAVESRKWRDNGLQEAAATADESVYHAECSLKNDI